MAFVFTPDEVELLQRILREFLSDLRMEIADTERYELRQSLKGDEERIKVLLTRLEQAQTAV
jgi:hypothetical protein